MASGGEDKGRRRDWGFSSPRSGSFLDIIYGSFEAAASACSQSQHREQRLEAEDVESWPNLLGAGIEARARLPVPASRSATVFSPFLSSSLWRGAAGPCRHSRTNTCCMKARGGERSTFFRTPLPFSPGSGAACLALAEISQHGGARAHVTRRLDAVPPVAKKKCGRSLLLALPP